MAEIFGIVLVGLSFCLVGFGLFWLLAQAFQHFGGKGFFGFEAG